MSLQTLSPRLLLLTLFFLLIHACWPAIEASAQPVSELTLVSGNSELDTAFAMAKSEVLNELVVTHLDPLYIPAYWGSYRDRECFCSRDICHQAGAGHLLGLDLENASMFGQFAKDALMTNGYWPKWSYDFYGEPYFMDADFRELPAPFEIVQRCYEQYLWTGDPFWINDTELFTYYTNTLTHFLSLQDDNHNGVADEDEELCTYWEQETDDFIEAGDAFGCQYQATLAYARVLEARGDSAGAAFYDGVAQDLREHFESVWYSNLARRYIRGFREDGTFQDDFGHENSFFIPLKLLGDQGERTDLYLDYIHENIYKDGINIEAKTYLPELYYHHGENALAWHWHLKVMRSNSSYPEVSFLIISNTLVGMMGIWPDAPHQQVSTISRLVQEVPWVEGDHIPVGANDLKIRHDGLGKTILTNQSGPAITWEARFYGVFNELSVDRVPVTASLGQLNGREISYTSLVVAPGQTVVVETLPMPDSGPVFLSDLDWSYSNAPAHTRKDANADGCVLSLDYQTFAKGLGVKSPSEVRYDLHGDYHLFVARVGVDDASGDSPSGRFLVYADGNPLHDTGPLSGTDSPEWVVLDLQDMDELSLFVNGNNGFYGDWAQARIFTQPTPFLLLSYTGLSGETQMNGFLDPGETVWIEHDAANLGVVASASTTVTCEATGPMSSYLTVNNPSVDPGILQPGQTAAVSHSISVSAGTPRGTPLELTFNLSDGGESVELIETFVTPHPDLVLSFAGVNNDDNGDGLLDPGESADLTLTVENRGTGDSLAAQLTCAATGPHSQYLIVHQPVIDLGVLVPSNPIDCTHTLSIDPETPEGTVLELTFTLSDGLASVAIIESFTVPIPELSLEFNRLTCLANGRPLVKAGQASELVVLAENLGTGQSQPATLEINATGPANHLVTVESPHFNLGVLAPGASLPVTVDFSLSAAAPEGTEIELTLVLSAGSHSLEWDTAFIVDLLCLSDMNWTYAQNGYKKIQRDRSNQGLPLRMNGISYTKGLGTHAVCEIRYDLGGIYTRFLSDVGIDEEVTVAGTVTFEVWLDGWQAFASGLMKGSSPTQQIDLDLTGVNELTLKVTDGNGSIAADHADWGFARLIAEPTPDFNIVFASISNDDNGDGLLDPGENADLNLEVSNSGALVSGPAMITCTATGPTSGYVTVNTPLLNLGVLNPGQSLAVQHNVDIDVSTPAGTLVELTFEVSDGFETALLRQSLPVQAANLFLAFVEITGDDNHDGDLDGGETAAINLLAENLSPYPSLESTVICTATGPNQTYVTVNTPLQVIGILAGGGMQAVAHSISLSSGIPHGTEIALTFLLSDGLSSYELIQPFWVSNPIPPSGTFLSDLQETYYSADWGDLEKDRSVDGNTLQLQGVSYEKGLGTHANSEIRYDLDGRYRRFVADVGVDDETGNLGSVTFEVWGDQVLLQATEVLLGSSDCQRLNLDVRGVIELKLIVTDGGDNINWDHADWADARCLSLLNGKKMQKEQTYQIRLNSAQQN